MPELLCEICSRYHPVWFTDNDIWNKHNHGFSFLCTTCFLVLAERDGFDTTGWKLLPEERTALSNEPAAQPPTAEVSNVAV